MSSSLFRFLYRIAIRPTQLMTTVDIRKTAGFRAVKTVQNIVYFSEQDKRVKVPAIRSIWGKAIPYSETSIQRALHVY